MNPEYNNKSPEAKIEAVEIVEVIKITFKKGKGIESDPVRMVTQYWDKENNLIKEFDSCKED